MASVVFDNRHLNGQTLSSGSGYTVTMVDSIHKIMHEHTIVYISLPHQITMRLKRHWSSFVSIGLVYKMTDNTLSVKIRKLYHNIFLT